MMLLNCILLFNLVTYEYSHFENITEGEVCTDASTGTFSRRISQNIIESERS